MSAHGPRFDDGYQFPRTDAGQLRPGQPILTESGLCGPWRATLELRPMLGGIPDQFAVTLVWGGLGAPGSGSLQALVEGEPRARQAFAAAIAELRARGEPIPAIPVPADTPLFRRKRS